MGVVVDLPCCEILDRCEKAAVPRVCAEVGEAVQQEVAVAAMDGAYGQGGSVQKAGRGLAPSSGRLVPLVFGIGDEDRFRSLSAHAGETIGERGGEPVERELELCGCLPRRGGQVV